MTSQELLNQKIGNIVAVCGWQAEEVRGDLCYFFGIKDMAQIPEVYLGDALEWLGLYERQVRADNGGYRSLVMRGKALHENSAGLTSALAKLREQVEQIEGVLMECGVEVK